MGETPGGSASTRRRRPKTVAPRPRSLWARTQPTSPHPAISTRMAPRACQTPRRVAPPILPPVSPVVGIPLGLDDLGRWRRGREYLYIDRAYARAVDAAGGVPVHLPPQSDATRALAGVDALLLPGGDDFAPPSDRTYPPDTRFELVPDVQCAFDRALLATALARGIPVLAICYGMQLLALHAGGRLHYHLPVDLPDADPHQLPEPDGRHTLRIEPGTRLAALFDGGAPRVNSLHHQAVAEPGEGLRVSARAEDGVVEAIESESGGFVLGVQWHPEKLPWAEGGAIFRALVAACS